MVLVPPAVYSGPMLEERSYRGRKEITRVLQIGMENLFRVVRRRILAQ
jgi:hypothetical protein